MIRVRIPLQKHDTSTDCIFRDKSEDASYERATHTQPRLFWK